MTVAASLGQLVGERPGRYLRPTDEWLQRHADLACELRQAVCDSGVEGAGPHRGGQARRRQVC